MPKLLATLSLLFTACAAEPSVPDEIDLNAEQIEPSSARADDPGSICDQIIDTEGACAHLCDESFSDYVPEGTCATFVCHLENGSTHVTGGCN